MSYTSQYPPAYSTTYVKATTEDYSAAHHATNPAKSLTGGYGSNSWLTDGGTNKRFHIDLGSAKVIKRIYYENFHSNGSSVENGGKDYIFQGSNISTAFDTLTYGTDTDWTTIQTGTLSAHAASDAADPKYELITNTNAYQYYALKLANNIGPAGPYMGLRRIELQTLDNSAPNTPSITAPSNSATGQNRNPTLTGSTFSDPDAGDTHNASQWQIATDNGFSTIVWDSSTTTSNKTSVVVNTTNGTFSGVLSGLSKLNASTTYYVRVRYQDNNGNWSSYYSGHSFTTTASIITTYCSFILNLFGVPGKYQKSGTIDIIDAASADTPTNPTIRFDTYNNKLEIWTGAAWKRVTLS